MGICYLFTILLIFSLIRNLFKDRRPSEHNHKKQDYYYQGRRRKSFLGFCSFRRLSVRRRYIGLFCAISLFGRIFNLADLKPNNGILRKFFSSEFLFLPYSKGGKAPVSAIIIPAPAFCSLGSPVNFLFVISTS